ncbi:MAG: prenyltransferase/squalene oxidase repeat-containing protein [Methanobacterium sp.]
MEENVRAIDYVWNLSEVQKILKKQRTDGSWDSIGKKEVSSVKYSLIETWRNFRYLIDMYEMNRNHESIKKASEYLFSCQSDEGDIRGILANQYTPYYTEAIMYLLIKAGYENDPKIEKGFKWLLNMRQNDGGWVIGSPGMIGLKLSRKEANDLTSNENRDTLKVFDKSKPFSSAGTGMVLRAFSVHSTYKNSENALKSVELLKSKFFKKDNWTSYQHPDNWIRFQFPFWWTNIISALDSISLMGIPKEDPDINNALKWLIEHQEKDGLWKVSYSRIHKSQDNKRTFKTRLWLTLTVCRIFKRFYQIN